MGLGSSRDVCVERYDLLITYFTKVDTEIPDSYQKMRGDINDESPSVNQERGECRSGVEREEM